MANLTTNSDIINDALFRAGEPINGTSEFLAQTISDYNRTYLAICRGGSELLPDAQENWWWLRSANPGVITLQPAQSLTALVTFNSSSITLSSAPSVSLAGWFLQATDQSGDTYRILAHTAGTTGVTIDSAYTGATNAAVNLKAVKLEYSLAGDCRSVFGPMRGYRGATFHIHGVELEELEIRYPPARAAAGSPQLFAMVQEQVVRFSHYPGDTAADTQRLDYDYFVIPSDVGNDSGQPLIPRLWRTVLSDFTTYWLFVNKNDSRAQDALSMAQAGLLAMVKENRKRLGKLGSGFGAITPRLDQVGPFGRIPRSTSGFLFPR